MTRKRRATLDQLDLFGARTLASPETARPDPPRASGPAQPVSAVRPSARRAGSQASAGASIPDEWWTTQMVCVFLKISRKTLWERRRKKALCFPRPVNLGGARNVYRASEVRLWAETKALAELCELS